MTIDEFLQPIISSTRPLTPSDSPKTIATWDSLAQINIISAVEDATGTELSTEEVLNLTDVRAIVDLCAARGLVFGT